MKITIHIDLTNKEEWAALVQLEDPAGAEDAAEFKFPAPREDGGVPVPFAFTGMMRTIDGVIQKRIWPEEIDAVLAELEEEKPRIIVPE